MNKKSAYEELETIDSEPSMLLPYKTIFNTTRICNGEEFYVPKNTICTLETICGVKISKKNVMTVYLDPSEALIRTNHKSYSFNFKKITIIRQLLEEYEIESNDLKKSAYNLVTQKIGVIILPTASIILGFIPNHEYIKHTKTK